MTDLIKELVKVLNKKTQKHLLVLFIGMWLKYNHDDNTIKGIISNLK